LARDLRPVAAVVASMTTLVATTTHSSVNNHVIGRYNLAVVSSVIYIAKMAWDTSTRINLDPTNQQLPNIQRSDSIV
jgi:hypothetical protein